MTQSLDLGLSKKYKLAGDGAIAVSTNLPAMGAKADGFVGIDRYVPVLDGVLNTPHHKRFLEESTRRLKEIDPSGPAARPLRAVELRGGERAQASACRSRASAARKTR